MARVTAAEVQGIIEADTDISMTPFIRAANSLTDYVDSQDSDGILSSNLLKDIELNLAAHFYESRDAQYASRSTGKASASFQGQWGKRLERTSWGQNALTLDITGTLQRLQDGVHTATVEWLGLAPSEQTDYEDRD